MHHLQATGERGQEDEEEVEDIGGSEVYDVKEEARGKEGDGRRKTTGK